MSGKNASFCVPQTQLAAMKMQYKFQNWKDYMIHEKERIRFGESVY